MLTYRKKMSLPGLWFVFLMNAKRWSLQLVFFFRWSEITKGNQLTNNRDLWYDHIFFLLLPYHSSVFSLAVQLIQVLDNFTSSSLSRNQCSVCAYLRPVHGSNNLWLYKKKWEIILVKVDTSKITKHSYRSERRLFGLCWMRDVSTEDYCWRVLYHRDVFVKNIVFPPSLYRKPLINKRKLQIW